MPEADPQFDAIDDAFAETFRILALGEAFCDGLPWNALDNYEKAEWLPRGRKYRKAMEERGLEVTLRDERH